MKLTVLIDNHTLIDRYFLGEPGLSFMIETEGKRILFDTGYSDAFIQNARKMSVDLLNVDFVVLSHGHLDHTWGLIPLIRLYTERIFEGQSVKKPTLVTHPLTMVPKRYGEMSEIGSLLEEGQLKGFFDVKLSKKPVKLTEKLLYLGEVERTNEFEAKEPLGKTWEAGREKDDFLLDDSALVYQSPEGLVVITGCSHAGICNIISYARKLCGMEKVADIIGGFHLLMPPAEQLRGTVEFMRSLNPDVIHPCHCTDLHSKIELYKVVPVEEVGVGLVLEY